MMETDDGVKREQLDYRAGYVEALAALLQALQFASIRCKKTERAGLDLARTEALRLRTAMIQKMKGGGS